MGTPFDVGATLVYDLMTNSTFGNGSNGTGPDYSTMSGTNNSMEAMRIYNSYTLTKVTVFISSYYLYVILVLGVPGNIASLYTILSMTTVSSSKAHVAILAVTDTVAIISKFTYSEVSASAVSLTTPGCAFLMFIQQFSHTYANWVVVAMTAERFVAVWFPLRVGRIYTRRKALVVLATFAAVTSGLYFFFFWAWEEQEDHGSGFFCILREEFWDFVYGPLYWIDAFYSSIIPCWCILIGNTLIILNIKKARKAARQLTNAFDQGGRKARDQRQITVMLVVVSIVFLLLNLPNAILYTFKHSWNEEPYSYADSERSFTFRFIHILSDSNHALNFYLYFLSMSSFRRRFLDAIRCRRTSGRRPGSSVYRTSQTYLQVGECGRHEHHGSHKRGSSNFDSHHSLKSSCNSNNNRSCGSGAGIHDSLLTEASSQV